MPNNRLDDLVIEDAKLVFKPNFAGAPTTYNPDGGKRQFCVRFTDPDISDKLASDGWPIRIWRSKNDPDAEPVTYMRVTVKFTHYPPNIYMVVGNKITKLDENTVQCLDYANIESCDLTINPYHWDSPRGSGVSAYLKTGYFVIHQDALDEKYASYVTSDETVSVDDDIPF
jgi:hypothetical protein